MTDEEFKKLKSDLIGRRVLSLTNEKGTIVDVRPNSLIEVKIDGQKQVDVDFPGQWNFFDDANPQYNDCRDMGLNYCAAMSNK